jgi:Myb-like DNA-binding domain
MLTKSGTNDVVGSQDEFFFAFKDVPENGTVLELDLIISQKRRLEDEEGDESDASSSSSQFLQHSGPWADAEVERFKMGVNTHGWGNWKRVTKEVATRTRKQVYKFSESNQAKRLRQTDSITGAWVDLAAGFNRVSKGLEEK